MKIDFESRIRRLSFLCLLTDIKFTWINPWYEKMTVILFKHLLINQMLLFLEIEDGALFE